MRQTHTASAALETTRPRRSRHISALLGAHSYFSFGAGTASPTRIVVNRQQVLVLTGDRIAERAEDIDIERAQAARRRAEDRLAHKAGDVDFERARVAMLKALTRLQVAGHARTRA